MGVVKGRQRAVQDIVRIGPARSDFAVQNRHHLAPARANGVTIGVKEGKTKLINAGVRQRTQDDMAAEARPLDDIEPAQSLSGRQERTGFAI